MREGLLMAIAAVMAITAVVEALPKEAKRSML
jgi:hypothetical protein